MRLLVTILFSVIVMDVASQVQVPGMYLAPKDSCANALRELASKGGTADQFAKIKRNCNTENGSTVFIPVRPSRGVNVGLPPLETQVNRCGNQKWGTRLKPHNGQLSLDYSEVYEESSVCYLRPESKRLGPVIPNIGEIPIVFSISKDKWNTPDYNSFGFNEEYYWLTDSVDKTQDYYHGIITVSDNFPAKVYFDKNEPVDLGISGKYFIKKESDGTWQWVDNYSEVFFLTLAQMKLKHSNLKFERELNDKRRAIAYTGSELIGLSENGKYFKMISEPEAGSNNLTQSIYQNGNPIPALQQLMDDFMNNGTQSEVIMTFNGQIKPKPLKTPDEAWQGINSNCNGAGCSLICSDGSFYPKGSNNIGSGVIADWIDKVDDIPGPWMTILAITDSGSKLSYINRQSTALILTTKGDDIYRIEFKDSSKPDVRPVFKGINRVFVGTQYEESPEVLELLLDSCRKNNWKLVNDALRN
jgi:hypothetical protein